MAFATQSFRLTASADRIQRPLLILAGIFLGFYALALTLSPAARARSWEVTYRWEHWIGYFAWLVLILIADWQTRQQLPNRDPYLLPVAALLSGWGLLTIWRLYPEFGLRQTMWLGIAVVVFCLGLRLPVQLGFLRRYKYLLLVGGLILTALTLIFGTNPAASAGPRLWLGCCGVYFQPSEPLKLLLIIFLSAYLAAKKPLLSFSALKPKGEGGVSGEKPSSQSTRSLSLLAPLLLMTGIALLLLLVQRDLGTATIFVFLFAVITYLATERKIILVLSGTVLAVAGLGSYYLFDVVQLRIDAWLNPWLDPSNRSYQIVQSLIAMAHGGVGGRGPGMGSPTLVPISHSDFIFSAIIEESGLLGGLALIGLLMLLTASGVRIALKAPDNFRRFLAVGLTAYLVGQSLLIIGGNIRLLPLTGVTLPFVSYGGSSLLTAFISLLILVLISQGGAEAQQGAPNPQVYERFGEFLLASLVVAALVIGWWTYQRGPALLERTDNARRSIADRYVYRGALFDRNNNRIATTKGVTGEYYREYNYPDLGSLVGYNHPVFGQSGLEASLDPYLRGLEGQSDLLVWWNHLLYGQPPPGLDVRLTLDMELQQVADQLLGEKNAALVLLNAENGEILALASQPSYEPAEIDQTWSELLVDENSPLINRVIQGRYPPGPILGPLLLAEISAEEGFEFSELDSALVDDADDCALDIHQDDRAGVIAAGCTRPQIVLSESLNRERELEMLEKLGFFTPTSLDPDQEPQNFSSAYKSFAEVVQARSEFSISPLQLARAAAALSAGGMVSEPQLASGLNLPEEGWTMLSPVFDLEQELVFSESSANKAAEILADNELPIWQSAARIGSRKEPEVSWYLAGTLPSWAGTPFVLVVVLESDMPQEAVEIGRAMMEHAMHLE